MADGTADNMPGTNGPASVTNPNHITNPSSFNGRPNFNGPPPAAAPPDRPAHSRSGTTTAGGSGDLVPVAPPAAEGQGAGGRQVRGRIDIADEVIEKVAAAAAYEVEGVADLGEDVANALEWMRERIGIGRKRDDDGVTAAIGGGRAEIDVTVTVKYGYSIVEVGRRVQANVAYQAKLMLGLDVTAVNVTIDDIEMPDNALSYKDEEDTRSSGFSLSH